MVDGVVLELLVWPMRRLGGTWPG